MPSDGAGTVSYGYDDLHRVTSVTRGSDTFGYSYLPGGQLDVVTYPGGATIDHGYRDDSRVGSILADGQTTSYGYDDAGNLTTISLPNGIGTTYTWDAANRLTNVEHKKGTNVLQNHAVTQFDANGNPTRIVGPNGTTNYDYDMFDRLEEACTPSCTTNPSGISYTYDLAGNRTTEVRYGTGGGTTTYLYDDASQLTSTTGLVAKSYSYDANGNQTAAGNRTFTYDSENRMLTTAQGGTTTAYAYDGSGNMLSRSVGGSTQASFLWDTNAPMSQLAIERDGSGAQSATVHLWPGRPRRAARDARWRREPLLPRRRVRLGRRDQLTDRCARVDLRLRGVRDPDRDPARSKRTREPDGVPRAVSGTVEPLQHAGEAV